MAFYHGNWKINRLDVVLYHNMSYDNTRIISLALRVPQELHIDLGSKLKELGGIFPVATWIGEKQCLTWLFTPEQENELVTYLNSIQDSPTIS